MSDFSFYLEGIDKYKDNRYLVSKDGVPFGKIFLLHQGDRKAKNCKTFWSGWLLGSNTMIVKDTSWQNVCDAFKKV